MSMNRDQLIKYLDSILEPKKFDDYGPNGLQVQGTADIQKILISTSISERVIDAAVSENAQCILVHHGLFWKNQSPLVTGTNHARIKKMLVADINLIAYHLPLDFSREYGNNFPVLTQLGVTQIVPFEDIGYTGSLPDPLDPAAYENTLNSFFRTPGTHVIPAPEKPIQRITMVSGGAAGYFQKAIDAGSDAYITGEGAEWAYHMARENHVMFSAMGHYATEQTGVTLLGKHLEEKYQLTIIPFFENNPF